MIFTTWRRRTRSYLGPQKTPRPEDQGLDRWEGTPEENAALIKVAMQQMGAAPVGIVRLDENTRKLIYSVDQDGKRIIFDDVEQGYEDEDNASSPIEPNGYRLRGQMSDIALRRAPTKIAQITTEETYQRGLMIQNNAQEFLRALGYQGLGEATLTVGHRPRFRCLSRTWRVISADPRDHPEFGPMVRIFKLVTDLPLAPDTH